MVSRNGEGKGQSQNKPDKRNAQGSIRGLMIHLPIAIVLGTLLTLLFYFLAPRLPVSQEMLALHERLQDVQKKIHEARTGAGPAPTGDQEADIRTRQLLLQQRADALHKRLNSYGLPGYYWLKLVARDNPLNTVQLHTILGVFLVVVVYIALIVGSRCVPGCGSRLTNERCKFLRRRQEALKEKWEQTGNLTDLQEKNETLSALDESEAVLCLIPVQVGEWLMPILGFLGTVVGVSYAIEGLQVGIRKVFAEGTLTADALESFNTGFAGLGVAFDTTFFGLVGLTISGLAAFIMRRRALAVISSIDASCNAWISTLKDPAADRWKKLEAHIEEEAKFRKSVFDAAKKIAPELESFYKWLNEEFKPGLKREFEENPAFRSWVTATFPRFLSDEMRRNSSEIVKSFGEAEKHLSGRVNTYGEILIRLCALNASDTKFLRRLSAFVLSCVHEAAQEMPGHPFWERFEEALVRPILDAPDMTLVVEPTGREVECLALSAEPYRIAVAARDPKSGGCHIEVHSLDIAVGETLVVHPSGVEGNQEMAATVEAMSFNQSGNRLAYLLQDGTVGLYDFRSGKQTEVFLDGQLASRNCLVWWQAGGEGLLVPLLEEQVTTLMYVPTKDGEVRQDEDIKILIRLEAFVCQAIVVSQRRPCVAVAGNERGRGLMVYLLHWDRGRLSDPIELPLGVEGCDEASFQCLSFSWPEEVTLLCGMSNGRVAEVSVADPNFQRVMADESIAPVIMAGTDEKGRFVAVASLGDPTVNLLTTKTGDIDRRIRGFGLFSSAALSPNRRLLAVGGKDGHAAIWEFPTYVVR